MYSSAPQFVPVNVPVAVGMHQISQPRTVVRMKNSSPTGHLSMICVGQSPSSGPNMTVSIPTNSDSPMILTKNDQSFLVLPLQTSQSTEYGVVTSTWLDGIPTNVNLPLSRDFHPEPLPNNLTPLMLPRTNPLPQVPSVPYVSTSHNGVPHGSYVMPSLPHFNIGVSSPLKIEPKPEIPSVPPTIPPHPIPAFPRLNCAQVTSSSDSSHSFACSNSSSSTHSHSNSNSSSIGKPGFSSHFSPMSPVRNDLEKLKPYKCPECPRRYKRARGLQRHSKIHEPTTPGCRYCGKKFSRKGYLEDHVRTHTGEKPYICQHCGKRFAARRNLDQHLLVHAPEKKHQCHLCLRRFRLKRHLRDHMHNIHTNP